MPARAQLPAGSRALLVERVAVIDGYLAPAQREEVAVSISRLFLALASSTEDGVDAQTRALVYADVLGDLPPFAVQQAVDDYVRGHAGDRKWAPTAAEVRAQAERYVAPWRAERRRIERALAAKVADAAPSADARAAVLAHARETLQQLEATASLGKPARERPLTRDEALAWLEQQQANPPPPPRLSPGLRKLLGLPPQAVGEAAGAGAGEDAAA